MTEPTAIAQLRHLYQNMVNGAVRDTASAKRIAEGLLAPAIEALERGTPPAAREPQWSPASTPPKESDGEVLVRMADGRCEIAWATYWHGSSNAFAQWTFRDPDEEETPVEWMLIPHGIKGGQHGAE